MVVMPVRLSLMKQRTQTELGRTLALAVAGGSLLLAAGCTSLSSRTVEYIGVPRYAPSDAARIEILQTEPARAFEKLGEVVVDASISPSPPVQKIEARIRREAAKLGADAVVLVHDRTRDVGAVTMGPWWSSTVRPIQERVIVATALKYK